MKATVNRKELSDALSIAASASSQRTTQTVLQSIRLKADDSVLNLTGCDGEMWASASLPANVGEPGGICVQQKLLSEIVAALGDGPVEISLEGTSVVMRHDQSEWKLLAFPEDEFPNMPEIQPQAELTLPMSEFKEAVEGVSFAVSQDFTRAHLTGVLFNYDGAVLTLVATDTHRLAVNRIHRPGIGSQINVIVPEKALRTIRALPIAPESPLVLQFDGSRLIVDAGTAKMTSQLLTGQYPNWERVIPQEFTRAWTIDRVELFENIRRAMILAKDSANRVRFSGKGDRVIISARSEDRGEAKEELPVISKNGELEIAFNGRYVMDAINSLGSDGVVAEMTESSRPAVFRPSENGENRFCVVMPMALS
ncbi:MAG: DNA polymerase III subunit beta [Fimbriimonadaceae bacterium]|nr:DNA polymerase III subunit beta [Fimbriimonadaceae bacterium]QYK59294.1 MAG: DNA polymerase III subunit beta [Fimbriimonadaceae bacterium]